MSFLAECKDTPKFNLDARGNVSRLERTDCRVRCQSGRCAELHLPESWQRMPAVDNTGHAVFPEAWNIRPACRIATEHRSGLRFLPKAIKGVVAYH